MFFEKVRGPYPLRYWRSSEGYRIERRSQPPKPYLYAVILDGEVIGQAATLDGAIERAVAHEGRA